MTSKASGLVAQIPGQLDLQQLVVDAASPRPAPACRPRDRPRSAGAHTARRADRTARCRSRRRARRGSSTARSPASSSIAPTSAGARYDSLASFDSKLAAKLSNVCCDVPVRRARRDVAAGARRQHVPRRSDRPGSSSSHSSKMRIALSISPSVQCASASSRRASGCFGLQRDHLAEAGDRLPRVRFRPFSRMPRLV